MLRAGRTLLRTGLVGFVIAQSGCYSYRQIEPGDVADLEDVRLTLDSGEQQELDWPHIAGDSLAGYAAGTDASVAVPLAQIETIEARKFDTQRTVAAIILPLGFLAIAGIAIFWSTFDCCL